MSEATLGVLVEALLEGDQARSIALAQRLRAQGVERERIVMDGVEKAMAHLDAKCTLEQFNLLEIMLCGRAVMGVMHDIYPDDDPPPLTKGTVVVATLEGDIHDLGKNIVKMVLTTAGYRVVDCGKDCPPERLVEAAAEHEALAVGVSGLITSVFPQVRRLRGMLAERGLAGVRLVAGGAAIRQVSAAELNVDFVAQNSFEFPRFLETRG